MDVRTDVGMVRCMDVRTDVRGTSGRTSDGRLYGRLTDVRTDVRWSGVGRPDGRAMDVRKDV